ncbi:PREDICTED: uncharacterized protein LOC105501195 [Colobus angolensis palliatus]|uniref:uncharacterized protein LOC105501195 n=1 Tax=Colobus angolensis palliatus TaxID=336983 RepID=UPI0005F493E4|nr:PREDICTED: uncharacterized protein LOC105501195 [Colobus angolensis palliatus]
MLPFEGTPVMWASIAVFCCAFHNATCLSTENPQDCGNEKPCAKEELDPPGCQDGSLCPNSPPAPCPPGTFLSGAGPHNASFCHLCPPGFFNPWPGQEACFPCGSEATQLEKGKDTCVCRGPGRVFQDFYLLDRPSPPRAVGHPCNLDLGQKSVPLYVVKMDGKSREGHLASSWSLSLNSTHLEDLLPAEPGIRNPTVCLRASDTLAFLVTHEHYPEYDLGHFYNTLEQFDWGRFRALAEESQLYEHSLSLFLQQFQQPSIYVFRLSSNRHQKMIQCHSLSWARKAAPHPTFRRHQQEYNLDAYISLRTGIMSMRRGRSHQDSDAPRVEGGPGGSWEAEEQVDLEWFDTEAFFGILLRQSLSVTAKLSQTKEELKLLHLKLLREARSLQQLWGARRCLPASTNWLLGSMQREQQQGSSPAGYCAGPPVPGRAAGRPPPEGLGHSGHRHWGGATAASLSRPSWC